VALFSIMGIVGLVLCLAAAGAWRLSQGPVSLSFLTDEVRSVISAGLGGNRAEISDVVFERDPETGRASLHIRDLALFDTNGALIAKAPRAAIGIDVAALFTGTIVPRRLELIGPNIKVRRLITGEIKMGFGEADQTVQPPVLDRDLTPETSVEAQPDPVDATLPLKNEVEVKAPDSGLMNFVRKEFFSKSGDTAASTINAITISNANISLFDQENDSIWRIPRANLAFKKVAFGASLFADAQVTSGKQHWKLDMVANYRQSTDGYSITARIFDLVPADLSKKIFILSQLTQVRLPLSGQVNVELQGDGSIKSANAELSAASGSVNFPDFLSKPINVDDGILKFVWEPQKKELRLQNSTISAGSSLSALNGLFLPVWTADGRFEKIGFTLNARNTLKQGHLAADNTYFIDRVDATGNALVEEGVVNLDDLLIMAGNAGVRMRGVFAEGDEALSMKVSGRVQDMPLKMTNKIWPPIVAPLARAWVKENISAGKIAEGTFQLNLSSEVLAAAINQKKPIAEDLINANLEISGVTAAYLPGQPNVENLSGQITIRGNSMDLAKLKGSIPASAGTSLQITNGNMHISKLADPVSQGDLRVHVQSDVGALLELADRPPLKMVSSAEFNSANISGRAAMNLTLKMPLVPNVPREKIKISAEVQLTDFRLKNAFRTLDVSAKTLDVGINSDGLTAKGKIKLDGVPAKLVWTRKTSPVNLQAFTLETTLDAKIRRKFGLDLSQFLTGPVAMKLEGSGKGVNITQARINADLSRAQMQLAPIHWRYEPKKDTSAKFDIDFSDPQKAQIQNLTISGDDLSIKGSISLKSTGELLLAKLPTVKLGRLNVMGVTASRSKSGILQLNVKGRAFDARPLIAGLFADSTGHSAPAGNDKTEVKANFDTVYAFRDRHIRKVRAVASVTGGALASMRLNAQFSDGSPMDLTIAPRDDASRDMIVKTSNGGAALRASNLYSKINGGNLDFRANLGRPGEGTIRRGDLTIRKFYITNERQLAQFQKNRSGKERKKNTTNSSGQDRLDFDKLTLPFAVDKDFVRIGDASVKGPAVGALAHGSIRKADGKLSIGGTLIPAYGLNSAFSNVPVLGALITGGKDEGVIGLTFGLSGTMASPQVQINPVSALAPGILRKVFEFQGKGALGADAQRAKQKKKLQEKSDSR
jgi:hypothetical protein